MASPGRRTRHWRRSGKSIPWRNCWSGHEAEKDKTELRSDLDELKKADLLDAYNDAMSALESAQAHRDKEQGYQKIIELGQDKVQSMKKELEDLEASKTADPSLPESMPLPEAEQQLIKMQSEHAALESRLIEIQNILDELKTRPAKVRGQVAEARKALLELGNQLVVIPGTTRISPAKRCIHGTPARTAYGTGK